MDHMHDTVFMNFIKLHYYGIIGKSYDCSLGPRDLTVV